MKTLEQVIAFNPSYREAWRDYLDRLTSAQLLERIDVLTAGLDHESRTLCRLQLDLVPYLFPHPLLKQIFLPETVKRDLLPPKTAAALEQAGFYSDAPNRLDKFQIDLDLPEQPLPEMLVHSGLKYIQKEARALIAGKSIIDGGAYIGDTAKLFCHYYQPADVYALEPQRKTFDTLTSLVDQWQLGNTIIPLRRMLSGQRGREVLWGTGLGASVIKKAGADEIASETVETTTIDDLVSEFDIACVGMIKLDVEGNELASIRGAVQTIERDRPLLLISIYHSARDFFEIKPFIEKMNLNYKFLVRKITDDLMKELILIGIPE